MSTRPPLTAATIGLYAGAAIMLARGAVYFLLRGRRPRLVLMDRGARIRGIGNIRFAGRTKIGANALVDARNCDHLLLGRNFSLGDHSILRASGAPDFRCPGITIGDDVSFGPYCNIGGGHGVTIGAHCIFGPYVSIHPETHVTDDLETPIRLQGVTGRGITIGADNWIAAKATILDGVDIGSGNVVAASALLLRGDYGSRLVFGGVPARQISRRT